MTILPSSAASPGRVCVWAQRRPAFGGVISGNIAQAGLIRPAEFVLVVLLLLASPAAGQTGSAGPPAVGVVRAERQQITQTDEFIGRIQAVGRVALVARVTAFLEKRLFVEGAEVKEGDLLYRLEQAPFQAQLDA